MNIKEVVSFFKRWVYFRRLRQYRKCLALPLSKPKILVLMYEGIGNAVEATPLVQAIRIFWSKAHITIYPPEGDLLKDWCVVDRIISSFDDIKGQSYLHTFVCSGCLPDADISFKPGRIHQVRCLLWKWFLKPEREYYMDMLRRLGYRGSTPAVYASLRKPEMEIPNSPLRICLVPGGKQNYKWRHKHWPYYSQLAEALLSEYSNLQICILGAREDDLQNPLPKDSRLLDLRGELSLRESAWIMKNSHIVIGNDCGPMHIANAVGVPSIIFFGPTCELKNAQSHKAVLLYTNVRCRPCQYTHLLETCENPYCMTKITPNIVLDKVNSLIKISNSSGY